MPSLENPKHRAKPAGPTRRRYQKEIRRLQIVLLIGGGLLWGLLQFANREDKGRRDFEWVIEVEMANPRGGIAQLFFDDQRAWSEQQSVSVNVPAGPAMHPVRFELPARGIQWLRFDPSPDDSVVRIGLSRVFDRAGRLSTTIESTAWQPLHQIETLQAAPAGSIVVKPAEGANDPMLLLKWPLPYGPSTD